MAGPAAPRRGSKPWRIEKFIDNEVKSNDVVLFMKGTPQYPMCGFSGQVIQILDHLGVTYKGLNVLESDDLRDGIKSYSNWPTIPQLYVKGEFVGGCDIVREMFQAGELPGPAQGKRRAGERAGGMSRLSRERSGGRRLETSARIELDHEVRLHLDRVGHLGELRYAAELCRHLRVVDIDVIGHVAFAEPGRFEHRRKLLRLVLHLDLVPGLERKLAIVTRLPFTLTWPWLTNWRAANTVGTNLAR